MGRKIMQVVHTGCWVYVSNLTTHATRKGGLETKFSVTVMSNILGSDVFILNVNTTISKVPF